MFRILALAGGGLRGAFAIGVLAEMEERLERPLSDYFELIAGTSTGSITASAIACGVRAGEVQAFYEKHSRKIFKPRARYRPKHAYRPAYLLLRRYLAWRTGVDPDHFFQSRYCPHALREAIVEAFGDATIADAKQCRLAIPTVNLTDGVAYVFRTPHSPEARPEYDWPLADIIGASAAAPTYFPHKQMPDGKAYADGGLWAIDPGVVALAEAANIIDHDTACRGHVERLDEVHMLSIGTGQAEYTLAPPGGDAGSLFWARHVAEVMSISQVQGTQLPLQMVLGDRYHIVDFPLEDPNWTLDNLEVTDQLFQLGRERGKELFGELKDVFFQELSVPYCAEKD